MIFSLSSKMTSFYLFPSILISISNWIWIYLFCLLQLEYFPAHHMHQRHHLLMISISFYLWTSMMIFSFSSMKISSFSFYLFPLISISISNWIWIYLFFQLQPEHFLVHHMHQRHHPLLHQLHILQIYAFSLKKTSISISFYLWILMKIFSFSSMMISSFSSKMISFYLFPSTSSWIWIYLFCRPQPEYFLVRHMHQRYHPLLHQLHIRQIYAFFSLKKTSISISFYLWTSMMIFSSFSSKMTSFYLFPSILISISNWIWIYLFCQLQPEYFLVRHMHQRYHLLL